MENVAVAKDSLYLLSKYSQTFKPAGDRQRSIGIGRYSMPMTRCTPSVNESFRHLLSEAVCSWYLSRKGEPMSEISSTWYTKSSEETTTNEIRMVTAMNLTIMYCTEGDSLNLCYYCRRRRRRQSRTSSQYFDLVHFKQKYCLNNVVLCS